MNDRAREYEKVARILIQAADNSSVKVGNISGYSDVSIITYGRSAVAAGGITYR